MSGIISRDCTKQRDGDSCRIDQSGSCPSSDLDPTLSIGIEGSAVSEREEFTQAVNGVQTPEKAGLSGFPRDFLLILLSGYFTR